MLQTITVTVDKHYAFTISDSEDIADKEENYNITIKVLDTGDFEVTGREMDVESFANDICIEDKDSVHAIMTTAR